MDGLGPYLPAGTRVRYDGTGKAEFGIVVHCWLDHELQCHDCHVAFYGDRFPDGKPDRPPYVLRYMTSSLTVVDGEGRSQDGGE